MYDYLVVGAGLYGAVFAHEAKTHGKSVLVIDKRPNIAGNVYTEKVEGINFHKYGAHIFHTNNTTVWNYLQQFATFNRFTNSPVANYKGELYSMPFNMYTFNKMWGVVTPEEAAAKIEEQKKEITGDPKNLEEQAISLVGRDIYEKLVKGYTEKQWGRECKELPAFIIKRLPVGHELLSISGLNLARTRMEMTYLRLLLAVSTVLSGNLEMSRIIRLMMRKMESYMSSIRNSLKLNLKLSLVVGLVSINIMILVIIVSFVAGVLFETNVDVRLPMQMESGIFMIGFVEIGVILSKCDFSEQVKKISAFKIMLISIGLLVIGSLVSHINGFAEVRTYYYGKNGFLFIITSVTMSMAFLLIAMLFENSKIWKVIGVNSMVVLLLHKFPIVFFQSICPGVKSLLSKPTTMSGTFMAILVAILVIALCNMAGYFIKKVCPESLGKKRKKMEKKLC